MRMSLDPQYMFCYEKWQVRMHTKLMSPHTSISDSSRPIWSQIDVSFKYFLSLPTSFTSILTWPCLIIETVVNVVVFVNHETADLLSNRGLYNTGYWSTSCLRRETSPNVWNTTHIRSKGPKLFTLADARESWSVEKYQAMPGRLRRKPLLLLLMPCFRPEVRFT